MHGDWQLALASYNWGEGAVGRAIAKNKAKGLPTDYAHLTMPGETRNYVPKLQAIKNIIASPQLFGITVEPIPNQPYFSVVERDGDMDVALAARLAGIPVAEFMALNPAYNRPVMPGSSNSPLVLPADKVQTYLDNLQDHEAQEKPLSAWRTYTLSKGEKLDSVARRHGLSLARLKQLNGLTRRTKTYPGFALLVPGKDAIVSDALAAQMPQAAPERKAKASTKKARKPTRKRVQVTVKSKKRAAKASAKQQRR
jgi:membrane-bound lytic murein transglycosylase D